MPSAVFTPSLGSVARFAGMAALTIGVAVAFAFAAAAALMVGLMITGAAIALRFRPRPARVRSDTLEARRTPDGWVVETRTRGAS